MNATEALAYNTANKERTDKYQLTKKQKTEDALKENEAQEIMRKQEEERKKAEEEKHDEEELAKCEEEQIQKKIEEAKTQEDAKKEKERKKTEKALKKKEDDKYKREKLETKRKEAEAKKEQAKKKQEETRNKKALENASEKETQKGNTIEEGEEIDDTGKKKGAMREDKDCEGLQKEEGETELSFESRVYNAYVSRKEKEAKDLAMVSFLASQTNIIDDQNETNKGVSVDEKD